MGKGRANGEGSIGKRPDGRWCARLTIQTASGPKRKAFYGKTRKEAVDKMTAYSGEPAAQSHYTLGEWMTEYLGAAKRSIAESTHMRYATASRRYIVPDLGHLKLTSLTTPALEDWRDDLLDRPLAPETVKHAVGVLSTALGRAVSRGIIPKNPVSGVKRPKIVKKMRPLSEAGVRALIDVVRGTRYEALYRVAATLGLRHGEIHGLFWSDLDTERQTLRVERSVDTHGVPRWGRTKTGEERELLLPDPVLKCLERHRAIQSEEKLRARSWEDERLIFPSQSGTVHRKNSVHIQYKRHLKAANLPDVRFHDLRHTAATLMLKSGTDVATAAQILGHKDPSITLRRYSHVLTEMQKAAVERMNSYTF